MNLENVQIKTTDSGAINYVRARFAIEDQTSGLKNRKERRDAKNTVISFLNGKIDHDVKRGTIVVFPDNTTAKF